MMGKGPGALQQIAQWSSTLTLEAIPTEVRDVARRCLIDTLGVTLAGVDTAVARCAQSLACAVGARGHSRAFGTGCKLAMPAAAFANGVAAHALDFDDNYYAGVVHGSAAIVPAAVAVAEAVNASGADLLVAVVAGSEAEYALGAATTMALYDRGWWTTGVLGPVGSCAAAARLLKLDANATASALGLALAGTGGTKACFGTDAKPLLCGRAAEAGIVAALLAHGGAAGPQDAAEHPRGFSALFNGGIIEPQAFTSLGKDWRLLTPGIDVKRIPVCLSSHAAVDAVQEIVTRHGVAITDIGEINCDVPPVVIANLAHDRPCTPQEAQFSMPFAIAASLHFGELKLKHLASDVVADPSIGVLMQKVSALSGPRWNEAALKAAPEGAHVRITLKDGTRLEGYRAAPRGSAGAPLSSSELEEKFLDCAAALLDADAAAEVLGNLRAVERFTSARDLLEVRYREPV